MYSFLFTAGTPCSARTTELMSGFSSQCGMSSASLLASSAPVMPCSGGESAAVRTFGRVDMDRPPVP